MNKPQRKHKFMQEHPQYETNTYFEPEKVNRCRLCKEITKNKTYCSIAHMNARCIPFKLYTQIKSLRDYGLSLKETTSIYHDLYTTPVGKIQLIYRALDL